MMFRRLGSRSSEDAMVPGLSGASPLTRARAERQTRAARLCNGALCAIRWTVALRSVMMRLQSKYCCGLLVLWHSARASPLSTWRVWCILLRHAVRGVAMRWRLHWRHPVDPRGHAQHFANTDECCRFPPLCRGTRVSHIAAVCGRWELPGVDMKGCGAVLAAALVFITGTAATSLPCEWGGQAEGVATPLLDDVLGCWHSVPFNATVAARYDCADVPR
jgi:hypothetical protein